MNKIVTQRQYVLITHYLSVKNDDEYKLNGMDQSNQEAFQDLVNKGLAKLINGVYIPSKEILTLALQKKLNIAEFQPDLKHKKEADKEYIIVVRETVRRDRHYHVWAKSADEAEEKMSEGPLNVMFKESAPDDERIVVEDWSIQETIIPESD